MFWTCLIFHPSPGPPRSSGRAGFSPGVPSVRRSLVCRLASPLCPSLLSLLQDYRLLVNRGVREALSRGVTARGSLTPFSQKVAREYRMLGSHARTATDAALSLVKAHRRRVRRGWPSTIPYCRESFLNADDDTFHLDSKTGRVRISLRTSTWTHLDLLLSDHHRTLLAQRKVKQLRLRPDRAVLILELDVPPPFEPDAVLALDTNERSLDGVLARPEGSTIVTVSLDDIPEIQHRHFVRRRRLGRNKATDRRVGRRLGGQEGRRERNRVSSRLHNLTRGLVRTAKANGAALVLEDLHLPQPRRGSRHLRRRLSTWPARELHRQLHYKAEEQGVPIFTVNPAYTSKTCPRCGVRKDRRSRVGRVFVCDACRWRCDRQVNAGLNICRTVLSELPKGAMKEGLGGLRLDLDALAREVMILHYDPGNAGPHEMSGRSGRVSPGQRAAGQS